ncbi:uncharacterized protein LOC110851546 isoform X2 [Folsomia candida]|uniref:uncharacterized protein LOC110851546 isoform X2 n=1 Tax=Folsomia candida TaxID=158441 RepID=UPI001604AD09|nr:uncharacterized protein LOC110851546 isoform X2 [Folsomia candida]
MLSIPDIHHSIVQHNTWQWLELKNGKTTHSRLPELAFHQVPTTYKFDDIYPHRSTTLPILPIFQLDQALEEISI